MKAPLRAAILIAGSSLALAWSQAASAQPVQSFSKQELTYEIGNTYRILGDEQFLNDDRKAAGESYEKAEEQASFLRPESGFVPQEDAELLKTEIQYRRALLSNDASFWGYEHDVRPINPVLSWIQFEETREQFAKEVSAIEQLIAQDDANSTTAVDAEIGLLGELEKKAVSSLDKQAAETDLKYASLRRAMINDRMDAIAQRQVAIAAVREDLLDKMSAVNSGLNRMLLEAVTQAAGLPPNSMDLLQGAAKGDVKAALEAGVAAYAAADPKLTQSLGTVVEEGRKAAREYARISEVAADVKERARQGAQLIRAVQTGDVGQALTIGTDLYAGLPASTQANLVAKAIEAADAGKAVQTALALARQGTELRDAIAGKLREIPAASSVLKTGVGKLLDVGAADYDEQYSTLLQAVIKESQTVTQQQDALVKLSRAWGGIVVDEVFTDSKMLIAAAVAMGSPCTQVGECRDFLISKLKLGGLAGPAVLVDAAGQVTVQSPATGAKIAQFSLADLAARTFKTPIEVPRATIKADADKLLARLDEQQGALLGRLLKMLPDKSFDEVVSASAKALGNDASKQLVAPLLAPSAPGATSMLGESIAKYALGQDLIKRTILAPKPVAPQPANAASQTGSAEEQAALAALAATGPYGLAASMAIKVLSGMGELADLADQAARLDSEDRALTIELLHLTPLKHEVDRDEALAKLAHRAAELRVRAAGSRGNLLQAALEDDSKRRLEISAKIRSRLPLNYFLAELLREQYDQLDQSLALWTGQSGSAGSRMESWLKGDPRSVRLALDPDIKLYSWFKRDWRGQRQDLDALAQHWNQLYVVAKQICTTLGCEKNTREVGFVEFTPALKLDSLAGEIGPKGSLREVSFTLLPRHLPDLQDVERLRLVDISAVVRNKATGAASGLPALRIRHSGVGYMMAQGEGQLETFEMSEALSPAFINGDAPISNRRTALQSRWASTTNLLPLEGYALFGLYQVSLPSAFDPAKESLELTFFYQRPKKGGLGAARLPTAQLLCHSTQGDTHINIADVRLLVRRGDNGILDRVSAPDSCKLEENRP
jgi:hypothetical protein